jgi:hypothetical protein
MKFAKVSKFTCGNVTTVDPTCPSYLGKSEAVLFREAEQATTVVLQKALGRIFVMVRLCHSNDFGSL